MHDAEILRSVIDHLEQGVYVLDRSRRIVRWNRAAERITGYLGQEVSGKLCQDDLLMHCTPGGEVLCESGCPLLDAMEDGAPREALLYLRHRNGHRVPVRTRSLPVTDDSGAVVGSAHLFVTDESGSSDSSTDPESCLDPETQLPVRKYGEFRLLQRLSRLERFGVPLGWLRIDLNDASALQKRFGHAALDAAALLMARALRCNSSEVDFFARWDRTSFRAAVNLRTPETLWDKAHRLVTVIGTSELEWWGDVMRLSAVVGGTSAHGGDTLCSLEQRTAAALEEARATGSVAVHT